jgi:hypothetical protein
MSSLLSQYGLGVTGKSINEKVVVSPMGVVTNYQPATKQQIAQWRSPVMNVQQRVNAVPDVKEDPVPKPFWGVL